MKYLPVHLPEAEKGDAAQVIIESTSRGEKMTCKEIPWEKISCIEKKKTLNIMLVVNNTLACGFYFHTSS